MAKVIEGNTDITNLQSDVMLFTASVSGTVFSYANRNGGLPGITVELKDSDGDIVATTRADPQGQRYSFNQQSGPAANVEDASGLSGTGQYSIVVVPSSAGQIASLPATVAITRGGMNIGGVDLTLNTLPPKPLPPPGSRPDTAAPSARRDDAGFDRRERCVGSINGVSYYQPSRETLEVSRDG